MATLSLAVLEQTHLTAISKTFELPKVLLAL